MSALPTVVLTGASAGIGLAALEALAGEAFVLAVSRTRPPVSGPNYKWIEGDLVNPLPVAADIARELEDREAMPDGLIHCAASYGTDQRHPLLQTSDAEWDELMFVNVRSQFVLTTRLLPLLLRRPQSFILALTSDAALRPAPLRIAYGCSKAASYALFSGLAAELTGSTVSVIQMTPERQVATRGIRRRRPAGFDFSGYSTPDIFKEPICEIVRSRGKGMHGSCQLVSAPSNR